VKAEVGEIVETEVGKLVLFPVTPDLLDRIEFRGVSRQPLDREPTLLRADEMADQARAMRRRPVPHYQQPARQVAQQVADKSTT
jgi:hypothetical protein